MAKLKQIKGTSIQFRNTDPQIYAGSWASGTDINTSRRLLGASGVSNSSGLVFGGRTPAPAKTGTTEEYNGTTWTEKADLDQARDYIVGAGTQTAALAIGGSTSTSTTNGYTESFNGSAWSEVNALTRGPSSPQSTTYGAASGSNTSALFYASDEVSSANARTESWDGSNWTEVADQNTARSYGVGVGTSNSGALLIGGLGSPSNPGFIANVEEWNGTSWTEISDINTVRIQASGSMQGSTESTIYFGGRTPPATSSALTENWNGTAWTEIADLATARRGSGGSGVGTSAFIAGGQTSPSGSVTTTEEWSFPSTPVVQEGDMWFNGSLKVFGKAAGIPSGSWGSAANLNTGRGDGIYGFGTTSLAGIAGGDDGTPGDSWVANTELYNGTSWSETADLNTARYFAIGSGGTTTAAIGVAGRTTTNVANVESWNGSSWSEVTDINTARRGVLSNQPPAAQTQILVYSGYSTTRHTNTESWDGSSWTELSDLNTSRYTGGDGGAGPSDAICAGGQPDSPGRVCEFWDGTTWSEGADLNTVRIEGAASASASTSAIYGGGNNPGGTGLDTVEYYNGSSWSEIADLADGGNGASHHIGSAHDTFFAGGISPSTPNSASTSTEHFTAPGAVATVTTS